MKTDWTLIKVYLGIIKKVHGSHCQAYCEAGRDDRPEEHNQLCEKAKQAIDQIELHALVDEQCNYLKRAG